MTQQEQKSINAIGLKQGIMDERQHNMADDITEIKTTLKEIQRSIDALTLSSEKKYVKKTDAKWYVGAVISLAALYITALNYIHNLK